MHQSHYEIVIHAPREKVWKTMLEDATYREWTAAFSEGSYFKGDWSEGSKMLFLGPDPEHPDKEGGMVSMIEKNVPNEYISIKHLGVMKDGVEDTTSDEVKKWTPSHENYTFTDVDGGTKVSVDMDVYEDYKAMFDEMWPKALAKLKEIAEK
jgi:uncharacterized protein YndB with AHSA1/START domain